MDEMAKALTSFVSIITILLTMLMLYGFILAVGLAVIATCAYPTYLALYSLELFLPFLKLNRPKTTGKKIGMNFAASFCTLFTVLLALRIYEGLTRLDSQAFREEFAAGRIVLLPISFIIIACLIVIYVISYYSESDGRDPLEKLESHAVPGLIKKVTGIF